MLPLTVPLARRKRSLTVPPIKFSMLLNPVPIPVIVPPSATVKVKLFSTLSAVKVSVPVLPSIAPVKVPPARVKVSSAVPPVRFSMFINP